MTQDEQTQLLDKLEQWDEAASIAFSVSSEKRYSAQPRAPGIISRTVSMESKVDSMSPRARQEAESIQDRSDLRQLQKAQSEVQERFVLWIDKQRAELKARHDQLRNEMRTDHESAADDLLEHHESAMAEAEDKQVKAEADMRETHEQEIRDNATALKHMEAYCAGTYSTGEPHNRTVTDQDRAELDKTRRIRESLDAKHSSAINVLRGEQGRRMKLRAQRQDREVQELKRAQRREELELERACSNEIHRFDESVAEKRKRIRARRDIQAAILTKRGPGDANEAPEEAFQRVNWLQATNDTTAGAATSHKA